MKIDTAELNGAERRAAETVAEDLALTFGADGLRLSALPREKEGYDIEKKGNACVIRYRGLARFVRALGVLASSAGDFRLSSDAQCPRLTVMADNSRNAVLTPDAARKLVRKMAILGFNSLQLYTEDTYEVPAQPYFGYLRGRWTGGEIRDLDAYAAALGVELVPCIQTLAHLGALTHWQPYQDIIDTADILLAGEEKTYKLIADMLDAVAANFSSRRINLGMDEAALIGAGEYFNRHGYVPRYEILRRHLDRVLALCRERGFSPMMWSDMFFRNWFRGQYYVEETDLPASARADVPEGVTLIYWDYYHDDPAFYRNMMDLHERAAGKFAFAGGAWKWSGFAPLTSMSVRNTQAGAEPALGRAEEIIATCWGDNGAECSAFAVFPVLARYADLCYGGGQASAALFRLAFGMSEEDFTRLEDANRLADGDISADTNCSSKYFLYNDPFLGVMDSNVTEETSARFAANADTLGKIAARGGEFGYLFGTLEALCLALADKADLGVRLTAAYRAGDRAELTRLAEEVFPRAMEKIRAFYARFRAQWDRENRPFGFEIHDYRLGGLLARMEACRLRLTGYLAGEIAEISELAAEKLDFMGRDTFSKDRNILYNNFAFIASANVF